MLTHLVYCENKCQVSGDRKSIAAADHIIEKTKKYRGNITEESEATVYWASSLFIHRICQAVRGGIILTHEVQIYDERGVKVDLDVKGQFIQPWESDLFDLTFNMLFSSWAK